MSYILTCGCKSQYGGFPSEWDDFTRENEPAIAYGCLCEKHYGEYEARPAQYQREPLTREDIMEVAERRFTTRDGKTSLVEFARGIEERHGIK